MYLLFRLTFSSVELKSHVPRTYPQGAWFKVPFKHCTYLTLPKKREVSHCPDWLLTLPPDLWGRPRSKWYRFLKSPPKITSRTVGTPKRSFRPVKGQGKVTCQNGVDFWNPRQKLRKIEKKNFSTILTLDPYGRTLKVMTYRVHFH